MLKTVPPELVITIFKYINDYDTIFNCLTVSKKITPCASIVLKNWKKELDKLYHFIKKNMDDGIESIESIEKFTKKYYSHPGQLHHLIVPYPTKRFSQKYYDYLDYYKCSHYYTSPHDMAEVLYDIMESYEPWALDRAWIHKYGWLYSCAAIRDSSPACGFAEDMDTLEDERCPDNHSKNNVDGGTDHCDERWTIKQIYSKLFFRESLYYTTPNDLKMIIYNYSNKIIKQRQFAFLKDASPLKVYDYISNNHLEEIGDKMHQLEKERRKNLNYNVSYITKMLPLDIFAEIAEQADFLTKLSLKQVNKTIRSRIKIKEIPNDFCHLLNDKILKLFPDLQILNARGPSSSITDEGLKHMNLLHTLDASLNTNITNEGIKHLDLYVLQITYNDKITDDGIKNMKNLYYLDITFCNNITDASLIHLNIHTLIVNTTITNNGIRHMKLHTLNVNGNNNITDEGIKHMNLYILHACGCNSKITDKGIKYMNLQELHVDGNLKITDKGLKNINLNTR